MSLPSDLDSRSMKAAGVPEQVLNAWAVISPFSITDPMLPSPPPQWRRSSRPGTWLPVTGPTHALKSGSRTSLWGRLAQHRGIVKHGGGNCSGSVFRKLLGAAIAARQPSLPIESWGRGQTAPRAVRDREHALECLVSEVIGRMPFLGLFAGGGEILR